MCNDEKFMKFSKSNFVCEKGTFLQIHSQCNCTFNNQMSNNICNKFLLFE